MRRRRCSTASMPLELAPFRFHGWLGNRKTQSFGWRYDFDDAELHASRPNARLALPLRDKAAAFAGPSRDSSSMCCSPATTPARASAGTATATSSNRSSASRLNTPATPPLPPANVVRLQARQPRGRAGSAYLSVRRGPARTGSTASHPASTCVSRSPSAPCRRAASAGAADGPFRQILTPS